MYTLELTKYRYSIYASISIVFILRCFLLFHLFICREYTWDDSFQYLQIAYNLPDHYSQCTAEVYVPDLQRMPLYPLMLFVLGTNSYLILIVQFLAQTSTAVLIYYITQKYIGQYAIAVGLAYWIMPTSILFSSLILTECFFVFLIILGIFYIQKQKWIPAAIFITASVFTRPNSVFLLFFMGIVGVLYVYHQKVSLKSGFLLFAGIVLALCSILTWMYRNYTISKQWKISTLADNTLIHGRLGGLLCYQKKLPYTDDNLVTQAEAYLITQKIFEFKSYYSQVHRQETELYTQQAHKAAYHYIFSHWNDYILFQLDCAKELYKGMGYRSWLNILHNKLIAASLAAVQAIFSLFCVGIFVYAAIHFKRLDMMQKIVFLSLLSMFLLSLLPYADTRYRFPLESLVFVLWIKRSKN
ncbi:MAG: hypothetical protein NZ519_10590 [Bacteroidia bacterium]|nr:hypothetical protein [Bacteroidia bacterium]MDW8302119.1 hypothetical protein [Bacteroidia bacterium]